MTIVSSVPLFPLRLILMPGNPQLLHVFEPRYRELLADCLDTHKTFGLPLLADGAHVPEPGDIGCSARILTASRLPDGRSNLLTEGVQRFSIESIDETDRSYFVGSVRFFEDSITEGDDQANATRVWERLRTLRNSMGIPPTSETQPQDPTRASFRIASQLDLDFDLGEEMLRLTSTTGRLARLEEIIQQREVEFRLRTEEQAQNYNGNNHENGNASAEGPAA
jgi:Lon protease-like protein